MHFLLITFFAGLFSFITGYYLYRKLKIPFTSFIFSLLLFAYLTTTSENFFISIPFNYVVDFAMNLDTFVRGKYYVAVTSIFLHFNFFHLFFNCFALYLFGKFYEEVYGVKKAFIVFFLSGVISNLAYSVALPKVYSLGASAAILGMFGGVLSYKLQHKTSLLPDLVVAIFLVLGGGLPNVNIVAHLTGLVTGFLLSKK